VTTIYKLNPVTAREDEILSLLQEECAEIIQMVSKIRRFGWDSYHPNDPTITNRDLLEDEIGDVREIIDIMGYPENRMINWTHIRERQVAKNKKLRRFTSIFDAPETFHVEEEHRPT
jgi:hypothetical protein